MSLPGSEPRLLGCCSDSYRGRFDTVRVYATVSTALLRIARMAYPFTVEYLNVGGIWYGQS